MKKELTTRLEILKTEYQKGQDRLAALEQETTTIRAAMLRISGAVQVLEELLEESTNPIPKKNGTLVEN